MNHGIEKDELEKDIVKLEYQTNEINKDLQEIYSIKKQLENRYTNHTNQSEIDNDLNNKIKTLNNSRMNVINLLKDKIIVYNKVEKETENTFAKVNTKIEIE